MESLLGIRIGGRFRVVGLLGEGAMGQVYLAEHEMLGRRYAIKVLRRALKSSPELVERFRREARAISRLDHPGIVRVNDFGHTDDGREYLVMEYLEGKSLRCLLEAKQDLLVPLGRACEILRQIADAVDAAHEAGVLHRDLKPENILLVPGRMTEDCAKICDFGLAKILADQETLRVTLTGEIFGTPAYMSPEQAVGQHTDSRTDIYSFGVLAFEMLAGQFPFVASNRMRLMALQQESDPPRLSSVRPSGEPPLPPRLEASLMRCLARDPEHRPPTLHEVEVDLADAIRSSEGAPRRHTSHLPQPPRDRALALWRHAETFESIVTAAREPTSSSGIPTIVKPSTTDAQRESAYDQMLKTLRSLAQALRDRRLGAVEMTQVTGTLGTLEERSISVQMEIALLESRIDDLERETREREAFLRYALVDLSVERGRLVDEQGGASPVLRDLDFQISALERRIGEVWASQQRQQETYEGELAQRQQALQELTNQQTELEMRLLELVRDARPEWPPAELERMYRTLEQLLEEAF